MTVAYFGSALVIFGFWLLRRVRATFPFEGNISALEFERNLWWTHPWLALIGKVAIVAGIALVYIGHH